MHVVWYLVEFIVEFYHLLFHNFGSFSSFYLVPPDKCKTMALQIRTARRRKQRKKGPAVSTAGTCHLTKHAKAIALDMVARHVETIRSNRPCGTAPHNEINEIIKKVLPTFPWLTKNMVKYHFIKLKKERRRSDAVAASATSVLSGRGSEQTSSTYIDCR